MKQEDLEQLLYRENLKLASISKRGVAFLIDELLLSLIVTIAIWDRFSNATNIQEVIYATQSIGIYFVLLKIIYHTFFTYKYGASIGKIYMKIKVINANTLEYPSFIFSLNRALVRIISEMFFYLGFLWGVLSPTKQTWHDISANTIVIES